MAFPFFSPKVAFRQYGGQTGISLFVGRISQKARPVQKIQPATGDKTDGLTPCRYMGTHYSCQCIPVCHGNFTITKRYCPLNDLLLMRSTPEKGEISGYL